MRGVRLDLPFREHHRRGDDGRGDFHERGILGALGELEIDLEHRIRIRLLRQRDEICGAILHRHDRCAIHGGGPKLRALRQRQTEVCVAAIFYKVVRVGEHLSGLRDARDERCAVHHLTQRIALRERAERELQIEWSPGVAIRGEHWCIEKQTVLRRHLTRLQPQQSRGLSYRLHLKLIRADDQRVPLLRLRVERPRTDECQRVALRLERALIRREQRVGTGHGRVQLHHVAALRLLPVADVLAGELHIKIFIGQLDLERRDGCAGDGVVHHAAAIRDAFADGEKMERIHLDGLRQPLDAHRRLPRGFTQPECGLDARDLARKKSGRDFRESLRALRGETDSRVRRHRDVSAHRLRLRHFDLRQRPACDTERRVALEAHLHDLTPRHRLRVHEPQLRIVLCIAEKIVAQSRDVQLRDGVAFRNAQQQFAQRCLAHVDLDFRINILLVLAEVKREHVRDRQLWQNLIGLNAQRAIRTGKAIREALFAACAESRLRHIALGKLLWRHLREALCLHDFETHRTFIHDAEVACKSRRAFGPQLHRIHRLRECADGRLRLHEDREKILLRLIEFHDQLALAGICAGLHSP